MAADPALALQGALVAALRALSSEAGERVYDEVPRDASGKVTATFPYVTVGEGQGVPIDEECFDRTETFHQIDVWTREVGYPQTKRIAALIRERLHNGALTVDGHTIDRMLVASIDYTRDPDGKTRRARIQVETQTSPATS